MTDTLARWHQPRGIRELGNTQFSWKYKNKTSLTLSLFCLFTEVASLGWFSFKTTADLQIQFNLVLSHWPAQFLLELAFNRRALRVRLVTGVKRNSSRGSTRPLGWRFMKWTSCCLCVVRDPFLGQPFLLNPRYQPLYLADTRAV